MRRGVLIALTVLALAGCAATQTTDTRVNRAGRQIGPALLRPDLSDDVMGGIQTRELDSVTRPGR